MTSAFKHFGAQCVGPLLLPPHPELIGNPMPRCQGFSLILWGQRKEMGTVDFGGTQTRGSDVLAQLSHCSLVLSSPAPLIFILGSLPPDWGLPQPGGGLLSCHPVKDCPQHNLPSAQAGRYASLPGSHQRRPALDGHDSGSDRLGHVVLVH